MVSDDYDIQYFFERSRIWRIKTHLQHTGWLQYAPPLVIAFLCRTTATLLCWSGGNAVVLCLLGNFLGAVGGLLAFVGLSDIAIIKFDLLPWEERRPAQTAKKRRIDPFRLMRQRRSCRSFQARPLEDIDRQKLLDFVSEELGSTEDNDHQRFGLQPIRLEYIRAPQIRVWPTVNASEFLVAIGPSKYDLGCIIEVGRVLQGVILRATELGLGTCWIGPGADQASVANALVAEDKFDPRKDHIIVVCAVGYASRFVPLSIRIFGSLSHSRIPLEGLFFANSDFCKSLNLSAVPFGRYAECCEAVRWSPSSFNAQPTRCVCVSRVGPDGAKTIVRFDFYVMTSSRFYAPIALGIWIKQWEVACDELKIRGKFHMLTDAERRKGSDAASDGKSVESTPGSGLCSPRYLASWIPSDDEKRE